MLAIVRTYMRKSASVTRPSMAWLRAARATHASGGLRAGDTHAPTLAYSVELLLHVLCARLLLQELHVLLELERSDLFLAAQWVVFPFDVVQLQLMLHTMELLLKLELVQLPLRLVQLLRAWLCGETGATCCLVPQPGQCVANRVPQWAQNCQCDAISRRQSWHSWINW